MIKIYIGLLFWTSAFFADAQRFYNDAHLDHLYQEVSVNNRTMGAIWIYCEAPDYHRVGDEDEGFTCIDDVARALIVYARAYAIQPSKPLADRIHKLTDFVIYMADGNGYWYNFMWQDGSINTSHINSKASSNFWTWRAYWALSEVALLDLPDNDIRQKQMDALCAKTEYRIDELLTSQSGELNVYDIMLPRLYDRPGADQLSVMLLGLCNRYSVAKSPAQLQWIKTIADNLALYVLGNEQQTPFGTILCWNNYWHAWGSAQYYALLSAYKQTHHHLYLEKALMGLNHFYPWLEKNNYPTEMKLKKIDGKMLWSSIDLYPQIAYGFSPMILAATEAATLTGDSKYAHLAFDTALWFFGKNEPGKKIYDVQTGRCFDGVVDAQNINPNAGAESTIEALLAMQSLENLKTFEIEYGQFINILKTRYHVIH